MFKVMGASFGIRLQLPKKLELNNILLDVSDLVYLFCFVFCFLILTMKPLAQISFFME